MNNIYVDITDIIRYSEKNFRVTGIQRVQLRLMTDIIKMVGDQHVKGMAFMGGQKGWQAIDMSFLREEKEFDATDFLRQTGRLKPSRFPPRNQIRRYLEPYNRHKPLRTLKKASVYLQALACPQRLQRETGLTILKAPFNTAPSVPVSTLDPQDTFAILGSSWNCDETEEFARQHRHRGGKVALLVYDIIPYTHPELQTEEVCESFNAWLSRTPGYVTDYICISEHTAKEMRKYLADKGVAAQVIAMPMAHEFPGYGRHHEPATSTVDSILSVIPDPFVLCVGSIEIRKNGVALLKAWDKVRQVLGPATPTLVFAGKIAWKSDAFIDMLQQTRHVEGSVHLFESPTDEQLAALYKLSLFTVYPSLVEGWGLPVGESAWFGRFAIASTASSIPEVCGPLVDYVDPSSVDDIAAKMQRAIQDRAYLDARTAAIQQAPMRTWQQVAMRLHELLHQQPANGDAKHRTAAP